MKKIKYLIVLALFVCLLSGCNSNIINKDIETNNTNDNKNNDVVRTSSNYKDKLENVMNSKIKFFDEQNKEVLLNAYRLPSNEIVKIKEYVFIDLDSDNSDELVVLTDSSYGAYMIFDYQDKNIYGYCIDIRALQDLKVDGTFLGSNASNSQEYGKFKFNKNKYEVIVEALNDVDNNVYMVNNKNTTTEKVNEYIKEFDAKTNVEFKKNQRIN